MTMKTQTIDATVAKTALALTKNRISLQRGLLIPAKGKNFQPSLEEKMSIQAELMQLGYILSEDALKHVTLTWFKDVFPFLQKNLGVGAYQPFYKNFPTQVMELSCSELYWNAVCHYWSLGTWEPNYALAERGFKFEKANFKTIKLGTEEDFSKIFTTLVSINQSITENDKNIITWFVENYDELTMPSYVPFKETLCMLAGMGLDVPVKTPTDVLRIAVHLSGGDISLPAVPKVTVKDVRKGRKEWFFNSIRNAQVAYKDTFKFKKFTRKERKYLLALLENTNHDLGEMKLKIERWLRLGEILHPGEYKNKYPKSFASFAMLRNEAKSVHTFHASLDRAFNDGVESGLRILSQNPGLFARKLDWLLRTYDQSMVMKTFKRIAGKVSRKVLWELYNHFLSRDTATPRMIMIKGKRSIKKTLPTLEPMNKMAIIKVQNEILGCLTDQFAKLTPLNNVWIDERLKKIPLPSAMRSINTSIKTYVRGTRISFANDAKVIRPFVHWYDESGAEDLDLSAGFYDKDFKSVSTLTFRHLRDQRLNSCHSGDVRYRQGSCAEYVDVDINACLNAGVRYVLIQVHNFESRPLHTLKDCVFGLMEREHPESSLIFMPKTISNAVRIANESQSVCVAILDLKTREYVWCDLELPSTGLAILESYGGQTHQMIKSLVNTDKEKLSVYDLLELHALSRGTITKNKENSDTKFEYDEFVTSYDKVATYM